MINSVRIQVLPSRGEGLQDPLERAPALPKAVSSSSGRRAGESMEGPQGPARKPFIMGPNGPAGDAAGSPGSSGSAAAAAAPAAGAAGAAQPELRAAMQRISELQAKIAHLQTEQEQIRAAGGGAGSKGAAS